MAKYIDADRLRAEIEERKQIHFNDYFVKKSGNPADYGASNALAQVLTLIDSLQEEQPPLPSDLEEAAKEIAYSVCGQLPNGEEKDNIVYYAILAAKAGAEWMAEQIINKINSL